MLSVGDMAPNFNIPISEGQSFDLSSNKGHKVVIYFYPKDDTPGCTLEAKDFRDHIEDFKKLGVIVIGISRDNLKSHEKFITKCDLNFPLASDENGEVCEKYGVWVEKSMYGKKYMGIERSTFLIDEDGKIAKIWRKVSVDGHVKEILENIK